MVSELLKVNNVNGHRGRTGRYTTYQPFTINTHCELLNTTHFKKKTYEDSQRSCKHKMVSLILIGVVYACSIPSVSLFMSVSPSVTNAVMNSSCPCHISYKNKSNTLYTRLSVLHLSWVLTFNLLSSKIWFQSMQDNSLNTEQVSYHYLISCFFLIF